MNGDYNSLLCVSVKPYGKKPVTFAVTRPGHDKAMLKEAVAHLQQFQVIVAYFGIFHDIPLIATRLLFHDLPPWKPAYELDPWMIAKRRLKLSRRSQGHILSWMNLPEQKMTVGADEWNQVLADPKRVMPTMIARCESDVRGLEALYKRIKGVIPNEPRRRIV